MVELDLLKKMDLFWGMNDNELQLVWDTASTEKYEPATVIFREGDPCYRLYIVLEGTIEISTEIAEGHPQILGELTRGKMFGEMALIDDVARSATATTLENSTLVSITRDDFLDLIEKYPLFAAKALINFSRTLSKRLRSTNQILRDAMYQKLKMSTVDKINLTTIIQNGEKVRVRLVCNDEIKGVILKVDKSNAGHEVTIQDEADQVFIVPYHSISYIHVENRKTTLPFEWQ